MTVDPVLADPIPVDHFLAEGRRKLAEKYLDTKMVAFRFEGEMDQMAVTARDAGLPDGFAEAAAEIYRRLADLKGSDAPTLDDVLAGVLGRA